jgi:hypothetical protein
MGKQLDKDMMKMMSVTERFKYIADKKAMANSISQSKEASLEEQTKHSNWGDEWVDRDESEWDSSSDGRSKRGEDSSGDDSNEY